MRIQSQFLSKYTFCVIQLFSVFFPTFAQSFPKVRTDESKRNYISPAIEKMIIEMQREH